MGLLNLFSRQKIAAAPSQLPKGSMTVDAQGRVLTTTLPLSFPQEELRRISGVVSSALRRARESQLIINEMRVEFPALRLTARSLREGAIIFVEPKGPTQS
jgi:hypothetical protein